MSIPARTVLITSLPLHLRSERVLAQYWEDLGLTVESVSVGRNVGALQSLLEDRTDKLIALEKAWIQYVGNPVSDKALEAGYDRKTLVDQILEDAEGREEGARQGELSRTNDEDDRLVAISSPQSPATPIISSITGTMLDIENAVLAKSKQFEIPGKKRPEQKTSILSKERIDLLDHCAYQYRMADEAVRKRRKGRFKPTNVAFVTFKNLESAQIAAQVRSNKYTLGFYRLIPSDRLPIILNPQH